MVEVDYISHQLMIIFGIIMYIFGFIGNILNICVFTIWSLSRRTVNENNNNGRAGNSSLYLFTTSVANLILIIYPLLIRILVDGYEHLVTIDNAFILCQFRFYVLQTSLLTSLICTCMATFDRYLITSRNVRLRKLSTSRQCTKKIIVTIACLAALHSIPMAIYYNRSSVGNCSISSLIYAEYYLYVVIVFLYGIFPICFLAIFGTLTYKQLKMLKQKNVNGHLNIDKQLSQMLLLQCIALVFSYIPYCAENIYSSKSPNKNLLLHIVSIILFYVNPATSFYVFYLSTPNFRHQVKKIVLCKIYGHELRNNQVHTIIPRPNLNQLY